MPVTKRMEIRDPEFPPPPLPRQLALLLGVYFAHAERKPKGNLAAEE